MYSRFDDNATIIIKIDNNPNPKVTRVFGAVTRKIQDRHFSKIVSLVPRVYTCIKYILK